MKVHGASPTRTATGQGQYNYRQAHYTRKIAPYGNRQSPGFKTRAVITGSDGWTRGSSPSHWFQDRRLLLPFGENPENYSWPVQGLDCILYGFGKPEPKERLVKLSVTLIKDGADCVTWGGQYRLTVFDDGISHAEMVHGALSEPNAPVFRPVPRGEQHG